MTSKDAGQIRSSLAEALAAARGDSLKFSILTILLTPAFVAGAIVVALAAAMYADLPIVDHFGYSLSFVTGTNAFLAFAFACLFARPKRGGLAQEDWIWIALAAAALAGLAFLSYGTDLIDSHPGAFWGGYAAFGLLTLGLLGRAYEPCDDYYLGWFGGWIDDPFTIEDDIDRGHLALGFASALPRLILGSYAEIFGSTWLIRGLDDREQSAASDFLHALGAGESDRALAALRSVGDKPAVRILRGLSKLEYIRADRGRPILTTEGARFVGTSTWI